jgi:excisionase family DNA binding protein
VKMTNGGGDSLLSREVTAQTLSMNKRSVDALIQSGELRSVKIGRRRLIRESDLQAYISGLGDTEGGRNVGPAQ